MGLQVATLLIKVYDPLSVWRQRHSQLPVISKNIPIGNPVKDILINIEYCLPKESLVLMARLLIGQSLC